MAPDRGPLEKRRRRSAEVPRRVRVNEWARVGPHTTHNVMVRAGNAHYYYFVLFTYTRVYCDQTTRRRWRVNSRGVRRVPGCYARATMLRCWGAGTTLGGTVVPPPFRVRTVRILLLRSTYARSCSNPGLQCTQANTPLCVVVGRLYHRARHSIRLG